MNGPRTFSIQFFSIILILGIVGLLIWYFSQILIYVLISAVLSYMLNPIVHWITGVKIKNYSLPRWFGAIISFIILLTLISAFITLFLPLLVNEVKLLQTVDLDKTIKLFGKYIALIEDFIIQNKLSDQEQDFVIESIKTKFTSLINITSLSSLVNKIAQATGQILFSIFAVLFMTFFMLKEEHLFKKTVINLFPDKYLETAHTVFDRIEQLLSRYFIGIAGQSLIITTLVTTGMYLIGVQNALLIGIFAGVINVIPYIGPLIGIFFGLFTGITTNLDITAIGDPVVLLGTKILIVFLIVQLLDMLIFQPVIFSRSVFAHPIEIFLVVMIGAKLGGPIGMFLALPTYTILRVTAKEFFQGYKIVQQLTKNV